MKKKILTLLAIAAGIGMIVYGAATGQVDSVFNKAINICLECIGIG